MSEDIFEIALLFVGISRYRYAGNYMLTGVDCSGFVCEILRSVGVIGKTDYSAQGLYSLLVKKENRSQLGPGSLLFFGENRNSISHVAIAYNDHLMIESGGGTSKTTSLQDAEKRNAYIRIRPIRKDLVACLKIESGPEKKLLS